MAIRDRMSTMLSNVSLDHDEGMDVQEANAFRFSEEPSLEKMYANISGGNPECSLLLAFWECTFWLFEICMVLT